MPLHPMGAVKGLHREWTADAQVVLVHSLYTRRGELRVKTHMVYTLCKHMVYTFPS